MLADSIYIYFSFFLYGSITNLLSVLHMLITFLSHAHVMKWKSQNDFKFGTSTGHFSSDRAASMAVKGLRVRFGCSKICLLFYVTVSKKTHSDVYVHPRTHMHAHTCLHTYRYTHKHHHNHHTFEFVMSWGINFHSFFAVCSPLRWDMALQKWPPFILLA